MDKIEQIHKRPIYEKPLFKPEEKGMIFPCEIIEQFNQGLFCVQCSSCHGCH